MERGLLLGGCGTHAIRLRPSLLFEKRHADEFLTLFEETLSSVWFHNSPFTTSYSKSHILHRRLIKLCSPMLSTSRDPMQLTTLYFVHYCFCSYTHTLFPFIKMINQVYCSHVQQVSISAGFWALFWPNGAKKRWPSVNASITDPKIQLFEQFS